METDLIEKTVILSFDELKILLHSMGVRELDGIYMSEKTYCEEDVIYAMKHLADEGFITAMEDRFLIRRDLQAILAIMVAPEWTDIWQPRGEEGPAFFIYARGDEYVISESFLRRRSTLKLTLFDSNGFEDWRMEWSNDHY
ncbi:MAG: hypothetical protein Q4B03_06370 [Lachnospiraceae bacterium]|nr:hypothetical protein [Lachnospiraceae bacterium]